VPVRRPSGRRWTRHPHVGAAALLPLLAALAAPALAPATPTGVGAHGVVLRDGEPWFPIGLADPPPRRGRTPAGGNALDAVTRSGVDAFRVGPGQGEQWGWADVRTTKPWLRAASRRGAEAMVMLRALGRTGPASRRGLILRHLVRTYREVPGLGMWQGTEEPFWNGVSPRALVWSHATVHELDPGHVRTLIQAGIDATVADLLPYAALVEGQGVDHYPVAYGVADPNLHRVGRWVRLVRRATPSRMVLAVVQICFSGSDDPARSGAFVVPTRRPERFMAYDAILNGARGVFFFGGHAARCHRGVDAAAGWNWTFWRRVLARLVRELGPGRGLNAALARPGTGVGLSADDARVQVATRRVGARTIWVIAAYRGRERAVVRFARLPPGYTRAVVYTEERHVRARDGVFTDTFRRWGVHFYRFRAAAG